MKNLFKSQPAKIGAGVIVAVLIIIAARQLFVYAQSVSDTFTDASKISQTWNTEVATSSGVIKLQTRTCDPYDWYCSASTTCANTAGDGDYIIVAQADASTSLAWKTANTACDKPQCSADGGQDGDNLKPDNTQNFGSYPARNYCKSIGGRLPTRTELECMYDNRASFGTFGAGNYWSGTENSVPDARFVNFSTGGSSDVNKANTYYVRCVRGW